MPTWTYSLPPGTILPTGMQQQPFPPMCCVYMVPWHVGGGPVTQQLPPPPPRNCGNPPRHDDADDIPRTGSTTTNSTRQDIGVRACLATLISSFHPDLPNKAGHPHTPHPLFHGFFDTMPDSRHGPPRPRRPARTPFSRPTYAAVKPAHPPHHRTASPLWRSPEYGAISPATAAPRAFPLPDRQWPHVRPARPASLGRLPGALLSLTVAPLGQPSPRPPLDCRGISKSRT